MNTLAWVLILSAILIARAVTRGRVMNIPEDLSDAFLAFTRGDTDALGEVLTRKGDDDKASWADPAAYLVGGTIDGIGTVAGVVGGGIGQGIDDLEGKLNKSLALAAVDLGSKAKGYRWAATGPDYYDCSGLMWRACQRIGYKGPRFSTASVRSRKEFKTIQSPAMQGPGITRATVGDIVLWPAGSGGVTGHMGVVTGDNKFYSARSVKSGIGESSINGFRSTKPIYLRYVG